MESIFKKTEDYVDNRIEIIRLKTINKSTEIISSAATTFILIIIVSIALLILSIGVAFWIGELMQKTYDGFLIVGALYFAISLLLFLFRKEWLKKSLENILVKKLLE